ncbi:MAG: HAMP domain-containing histidine kinase [Anaerolineae bacterium]|nr:HAMP domain-containing histidine kinase [Anaerolineae bacterium]
MKWRWLTALVPAALVLLAVLLLRLGSESNPILVIRVDLATAALIVGLGASALIAVTLAVWEWVERVRRRTIRRVQAQAAEDRIRFLRRLDHELKNPLTAIRAGLANVVEAPSEDMRQKALVSVEDQALRLSRLVADLRKLAELGRYTIERSSVDVALLLREALVIAQERPEAQDRRITFSIPQAPWPLPAVYGDWDLLSLAIHNLLDNALKFTRPGDTIELRAFEDGSTVIIEVADTGAGIPDAEMPHVWEELYRGKGARGVAGSGLGLSLVRAVAERHGGQVMLRSRLGEGTVFSLRLPVARVTER